jgi:class 3 adenylate cyclase
MSTPSDLPLATLQAYLAPDRLASLAVGQPLAERDQGSAVFADISGFTPLTEALNAQWGPRRGAEELGRRLDAVYTALIAEVEAHRGSVIGFAGDAILCWFSATTAPSAARAVGCAFQFQKVMSGFSAATEGGGLGIKVSVATGTVRRLVAGDPACQLHDALAGATIARLALGEHFSQRGEVVLDDATRALLPHLEVRYERHDAVTSTRFTVVTSFEDSYQQLPAGHGVPAGHGRTARLPGRVPPVRGAVRPLRGHRLGHR